MEDETRSNTPPISDDKPKRGRPFAKGDPRINRKGRPKSFDQLRALAQQLAQEAATGKEGPIVIDGHIVTQIEALMRQMIHDDPARFVEIAFGKVPQPVDIESRNETTIRVIRDDDD